MAALVEHLLEELELRGCWEDEDQQNAEERLEEHFRFDLFRQLLYACFRVLYFDVVGVWHSWLEA